MPTFLSDPAPGLYLVLIAVVLVTGTVVARNQDRRSLARFGIAAGVLGLVYLIDRLIESPREEAVRHVQEMVAAADTRNPSAFVAHIADRVEYVGEGQPRPVTREQIRASGFWSILSQHQVHVAAWDFSRDDVRDVGPDAVEIGFLAKGEAEGKQFPMYFRATFSRQSDGQMRLTRLASFDPMQRANKPVSIPFFP